jgi:hypothetical protein
LTRHEALEQQVPLVSVSCLFFGTLLKLLLILTKPLIVIYLELAKAVEVDLLKLLDAVIVSVLHLVKGPLYYI